MLKWLEDRITNQKTIIKSPNDNQLLSPDLQKNLADLKCTFKNCSDIVFRTMQINPDISFLLIYVEGLVDARGLEQNILKPLLYENKQKKISFEYGEIDVLPLSNVRIVSTLEDVIQSILKSNIAKGRINPSKEDGVSVENLILANILDLYLYRICLLLY